MAQSVKGMRDLFGRELRLTRVATFRALPALQLTSIRPGWMMLSPVCAVVLLPPLTNRPLFNISLRTQPVPLAKSSWKQAVMPS